MKYEENEENLIWGIYVGSIEGAVIECWEGFMTVWLIIIL